MKVIISLSDLQHFEDQPSNFPSYVSGFLNSANRFSRGTRPEVVGKMTELIREFPGRTLDEWKEWYLKKHPMGIDNATTKILSKIDDYKNILTTIDREMVRRWVADLVLDKTFTGLRIQEAILKQVSELRKCDYRISSPREESQGIDGFIGDKPVSIKPESYRTMPTLNENIRAELIIYSKTKKGIEFDIDI
jgi:hypothetical protein